ncbi:hypothetical protein DACRYDRAFT_21873 [Dacryopinax primogenitus]|uniref:Uncharacterized protein n=1 Tax=Dacryopinax primogenitus (strain DJM 731) TaxID=1858805 RepID=M5FW44_DACPD|nr:uncharacterized protein DACRYDRAFT_21873 [Dacryopinax primogenitus]EJU02091.1 hypothetical protein DACRYDRAFT_21873 [Dacryopinax primogenitus]
MRRISALQLANAYPEIVLLLDSGRYDGTTTLWHSPGGCQNRWRQRARGRRVYSIPIMVWVDDVSGNVSKMWNKHLVLCASTLGLPRRMLDESGNIYFIGTSTFAGALELMEAVVRMTEEINTSEFESFDALYRELILINVWPAILAGDNPMQAELCSHKSFHSNKFCRRRHVGGTSTERSPQGYGGCLRSTRREQAGKRRPVSDAC